MANSKLTTGVVVLIMSALNSALKATNALLKILSKSLIPIMANQIQIPKACDSLLHVNFQICLLLIAACLGYRTGSFLDGDLDVIMLAQDPAALL